MTSPDPAWQSRAACLGSDPAIFYPKRGDSSALYEARATCYGCEVKAECFEQAMTTPIEEEGVWGGRSAQERRRMRSGEIEPSPIEVEPVPPRSKVCDECGDFYKPERSDQMFCSKRCKWRDANRRRRATPDGQERARQVRRSYYAENGDYCREWQRQYRRRTENVGSIYVDYNDDNKIQEKAGDKAHDAA